eukprot:CAMPEP_0183367940 /NCGR_PEP_ID=MMETSP0164_2-20130417/94149_1 /TAXON_ID=221442 /ORGANISM="Coccolithus pelagicus ssp braarudi, Strain PLY182g" /LENGTH=83 /DNA_ID=CAMNT_0025543955 /DNA_START=139 /DNA_END=387 /DNA_ORIENTATION=-
MAWEEGQIGREVGKLGSQALVHVFHARAGQVKSATGAGEDGVACDEQTLLSVHDGEEDDRARRVAGRVPDVDLDAADSDDVSV